MTIGASITMALPGVGHASPRALQVGLKAQPLATSLTAMAGSLPPRIAHLPGDVPGIPAPAPSRGYTAGREVTMLPGGFPLDRPFAAAARWR